MWWPRKARKMAKNNENSGELGAKILVKLD